MPPPARPRGSASLSRIIHRAEHQPPPLLPQLVHKHSPPRSQAPRAQKHARPAVFEHQDTPTRPLSTCHPAFRPARILIPHNTPLFITCPIRLKFRGGPPHSTHSRLPPDQPTVHLPAPLRSTMFSLARNLSRRGTCGRACMCLLDRHRGFREMQRVAGACVGVGPAAPPQPSRRFHPSRPRPLGAADWARVDWNDRGGFRRRTVDAGWAFFQRLPDSF